MKRIISVLLIFCLMMALCSCVASEKASGNSIVFYYRSSEINYGSQVAVIAGEVRSIAVPPDDYRALVEEYLNGPISKECVSPFPAGITLEALNIDNNKVQIILSPHLALLSGGELTTACACLANTLLEMTGVRSVQISADNGLLNGSEVITFTADSFVYWDDSVQFIHQDHSAA